MRKPRVEQSGTRGMRSSVVLGNSMEVCQRNADASERRPYLRTMNDLRILMVGTADPSRPFVDLGNVSEFR